MDRTKVEANYKVSKDLPWVVMLQRERETIYVHHMMTKWLLGLCSAILSPLQGITWDLKSKKETIFVIY